MYSKPHFDASKLSVGDLSDQQPLDHPLLFDGLFEVGWIRKDDYPISLSTLGSTATSKLHLLESSRDRRPGK